MPVQEKQRKHLVLVLSEPREGQEDAYHDYYENLHLDEVLETTSWRKAQRYALTDSIGQDCPLPFLAVYEAYGEDPKRLIQEMNETRDQRQQSKSINKRTAGVWVFSEIGEEHGE